MILVVVGIAILSPFDDLFVLLPASVVFGPEIFPIVLIFGVLCLAIGILLMGRSVLLHFGLIGRTVFRHPVVVLGTILVICILVYCWLTGTINF